LLGAGQGAFRAGAQRIAIQINNAIGQVEVRAQGGEGIGGIAGKAVVA
jgi:hypothetical protein